MIRRLVLWRLGEQREPTGVGGDPLASPRRPPRVTAA